MYYKTPDSKQTERLLNLIEEHQNAEQMQQQVQAPLGSMKIMRRHPSANDSAQKDVVKKTGAESAQSAARWGVCVCASHVHLLIHSLIHSLTHSLTYSLTHSLTHSHTILLLAFVY